MTAPNSKPQTQPADRVATTARMIAQPASTAGTAMRAGIGGVGLFCGMGGV